MVRTCQVCGDAAPRYRHDWLFRCDECGVLSADLTVSIPNQACGGVVDEEARSAGLDALRRPPGARLLDVGSGPGFLIDQARTVGFSPTGIEPDANIAEKVNVRRGYFPDALGAEERFDVIVFNDVLEHIPDLTSALKASVRHLSPGGILCLNCPDRRGFFYLVAAILDRLGVHGPYDRLWQRGLPSPHVWYFTPDLLRRAAVSFGLQPIGTERLAPLVLRGLGSRIRADRSASLPLSLASWAFAVLTYPLARIMPSDATACLFRKY
jgi:SAM-dependent methyltransferase